MTTVPIDQASAVPYRRSADGRVELCLVTSMSRRRWGFPKGIVDPGETPRETALKEAREEAGLTGTIEGDPIGDYEYAKWGTTLRVTVYVMRVTGIEDEWPERVMRERRWAGATEARQLVTTDRLIPILEAALRRLETGLR
jgi:phosphohistidine phosphatase